MAPASIRVNESFLPLRSGTLRERVVAAGIEDHELMRAGSDRRHEPLDRDPLRHRSGGAVHLGIDWRKDVALLRRHAVAGEEHQSQVRAPSPRSRADPGREQFFG